jgi:hypothetical protein
VAPRPGRLLSRVVASVSAATAETAARDETGQLTRILGAHLQDEHDLEVDEEEVTELVESEAYEAMDS